MSREASIQNLYTRILNSGPEDRVSLALKKPCSASRLKQKNIFLFCYPQFVLRVLSFNLFDTCFFKKQVLYNRS